MTRSSLQNKKVLAIVPARKGSKGLKDKNIKKFAGKPLIYWSIKSAKNSKYINNLIVSTDSKKIRNYCKSINVDVPFLRPKKISKDNSKSIEFIIHALNFLKKKGKFFDYVVLLEPTSPLREVSDIEKGLEKLFKIGEGSVVSVCESEGGHPSFSYVQSAESKLTPFTGVHPTNLRRQDIDPVYFLDGTFYASFVKDLYKYKSFYHEETYSIVVPKWKSLEIDDIYDFAMVEAVMKLKDEGFNSH